MSNPVYMTHLAVALVPTRPRRGDGAFAGRVVGCANPRPPCISRPGTARLGAPRQTPPAAPAHVVVPPRRRARRFLTRRPLGLPHFLGIFPGSRLETRSGHLLLIQCICSRRRTRRGPHSGRGRLLVGRWTRGTAPNGRRRRIRPGLGRSRRLGCTQSNLGRR